MYDPHKERENGLKKRENICILKLCVVDKNAANQSRMIARKQGGCGWHLLIIAGLWIFHRWPEQLERAVST